MSDQVGLFDSAHDSVPFANHSQSSLNKSHLDLVLCRAMQ